MGLFNFENLEFRYTPFPIGRARPIMDQALYEDMLDAWPPDELFQPLSKVGEKFTLSEKFNPETYRKWIAAAPVWREFHRWVKSDAFVREVFAVLAERGIDLGYDLDLPGWKRILRRCGDFAAGRDGRYSLKPRSRFEFSMLPARGGCVLPHTDGIWKLVTLVVSMVREGEWREEYGGGTDVNVPRDIRRNYNWMNEQLSFDEVEVLDTFAYLPNQAVVFVKTFNSLHSVRPMRAEEEGLMRRTLTINIEVPT